MKGRSGLHFHAVKVKTKANETTRIGHLLVDNSTIIKGIREDNGRMV